MYPPSAVKGFYTTRSFDVESLFTNVPIDPALDAALQKLENDPSLVDRSTLAHTQIADLLNLVLRNLVSAVIANLFMESFEEQAIATSLYQPRIWRRYVDDTFTVLDLGSVDSLLQHLNNQQPSIRFTMETESDSKPAFLDITVSRKPTAAPLPACT